MSLFKRIDSFDVTFADSFANPDLKVNEVRVHRDGQEAKKGVGEKRIYCGHDEKALDEFFRFDLNPTFFLQKDDLEDYSRAIEPEYLNPQYPYGDGVGATYAIWKRNSLRLSELKEDRLYLEFEHKYDDQNRYYVSLPRRCKETQLWHDNWDYMREVCLPRVSRLLFVKLIDTETGKLYIYIKPFYGGLITGTKKTEVATAKPLKDEKGNTARKGQEKYREQVFNRYSYCVVTHVTDPNLLIACHIKGYANCSPVEQYDKFNGFTMTPTIHSLFDMGYLTFDDNGKMILSDFFRNNDRRCLNLFGRSISVPIVKEMLPYLHWHNEHTFIRTSRGVQIVGQE
jgi:hypothetical protein